MSTLKFTAKEIALYPLLKEEPETCRHFLSTFLPARGFPLPAADADHAVTVSYINEVIVASGSPKSESRTVNLPKGALDRTMEDQGVVRLLNNMLLSRFNDGLVSLFQGVRCCACQNVPEVVYTARYREAYWSESGSFTIKATHLPYCSEKSKCHCTVSHIRNNAFPVQGAFGLCTFCNKVEDKPLQFKQCPRCKAVLYCSEECQKNHWKVHKKECHDMPFCLKCKKVETEPNSFLQCGRCMEAMYCSKSCQEKHWKKHKKVCKPKDA